MNATEHVIHCVIAILDAGFAEHRLAGYRFHKITSLIVGQIESVVAAEISSQQVSFDKTRVVEVTERDCALWRNEFDDAVFDAAVKVAGLIGQFGNDFVALENFHNAHLLILFGETIKVAGVKSNAFATLQRVLK